MIYTGTVNYSDINNSSTTLGPDGYGFTYTVAATPTNIPANAVIDFVSFNITTQFSGSNGTYTAIGLGVPTNPQKYLGANIDNTGLFMTNMASGNDIAYIESISTSTNLVFSAYGDQTTPFTQGSLTYEVWIEDPATSYSDWSISSGQQSIANKPTLATVATTGVYSDLSGAPHISSIHNTVSRSLNSSFTISSSYEAYFNYSVEISVTIALSARTGTITPQYSTDGGSTWISLPYAAFTPPLAGLGLLSTQVVQVSGWISANALVQIVTTSVTGVSYTYINGQERY